MKQTTKTLALKVMRSIFENQPDIIDTYADTKRIGSSLYSKALLGDIVDDLTTPKLRYILTELLEEYGGYENELLKQEIEQLKYTGV